VVASKPFLQIYNRDDNSGQFPKFNFMQGDRLSNFVGTGKIAIWVWLGILLFSVFSFVKAVRQDKLSATNRFAIALLGCVAFNFFFHLIYGFEPFLYAADWTFALILFAALASSQIKNKFWLHAALVVLIALLTLNNLSFLYLLMNGISPFI
jgi:hypothetical protein